jgi:hypothetical protein
MIPRKNNSSDIGAKISTCIYASSILPILNTKYEFSKANKLSGCIYPISVSTGIQAI